MKKKSRVFKIVIWSLAVIVLLFGLLIVHIAMVTKPVQYDNNNLQLSRIDFKQPIDPSEAAKIRHYVVSLPGVENASFNLTDRTLVYGYITGQQSSANVYNLLMAFGHYKAEKYVVSQAMLNSGCPMGKIINSKNKNL